MLEKDTINGPSERDRLVTLRLQLAGLEHEEQSDRWALQEEHQQGLEEMCSWLDRQLDLEGVAAVEAMEMEERRMIEDEVDGLWGTEFQASATSLRIMAYSERRHALLKLEMRARKALMAMEAGHRETYARVMNKWAIENAEQDARRVIEAECDQSYVEVLKGHNVGLEGQRRQMMDQETKARELLAKMELKERSITDARATMEWNTRQVWHLQKEELQAREAIQKLQMSTRTSLRQRADQDHRLVLLVEAELQRRMSLLQEPAHFWQQINSRMTLEAQQRQSALQEAMGAVDALATQEQMEWQRLADAFAMEWKNLCNALFHWMLQCEWDNRDAIEDEEDDEFLEFMEAAEASSVLTTATLALQQQDAVGRKTIYDAFQHDMYHIELQRMQLDEAVPREALLNLEHTCRAELILDFNCFPEAAEDIGAQSPAVIHLPTNTNHQAQRIVQKSIASLSPTCYSESSEGGALSSLGTTPFSTHRSLESRHSDDSAMHQLCSRKLAPLLPNYSSSGASHATNAPPHRKVVNRRGRGPIKASEKQKIAKICEGLLQDMEEVLTADTLAAPKLPPLMRAQAADRMGPSTLKRKHLERLSMAQSPDRADKRLPPISLRGADDISRHLSVPAFA